MVTIIVLCVLLIALLLFPQFEGTHDIQNIIVNSSTNLSLSVDYAEGSMAQGVFIVLLFVSNSSGQIDFNRSVYTVLERDFDDSLPFPIPDNEYIVLGYDIEANSRLQTGVGYPAIEENVTTISGNSIGMDTVDFMEKH